MSIQPKCGLTSISSRIATARFLKYTLPAKLCLVGTSLAHPQSAEMQALGGSITHVSKV
jgi:hypothetical protein